MIIVYIEAIKLCLSGFFLYNKKKGVPSTLKLRKSKTGAVI
jgi:hypothetical protein